LEKTIQLTGSNSDEAVEVAVVRRIPVPQIQKKGRPYVTGYRSYNLTDNIKSAAEANPHDID
jgi:hypothetical protein